MNKFENLSGERLQSYIPSDLQDTIEYLEHIYPWVVFDKNISEREVWIKVGHQQVIQFLKSKLKGLEEQNVFT